MSGFLRTEFQRAFINQRLWLIPILALAGLWAGYRQFPIDPFLEGATKDVYRLWTLWYAFSFFNYLAPLLAAIPYSDSLITDRRYGFLKHILTRCSMRRYLAVRTLANAAVGALSVCIPVALMFIYCYTIMPVEGPVRTIGETPHVYPNYPMGLLGYLYLQQPYLYLAFLVLMAAIFGAVYATFGLAVSAWVNNPYVAIAAPFAFLVVFGYLTERSLHLAVIGHPAGALLPFRYGLYAFQIGLQYAFLALAFMISFVFYSRSLRNQRLA
ncbi:MAG: hypothetical protein GYA34_17360 [Chloroflexi bacterium]|nr:hypothetical protein [Chloroflexota bacterium]